MERKIVLGVLAVSLLLLAVTLLLPGGRAPDAEPLLPWKIHIAEDGSLRVFGLTLGSSTLEDARRQFEEEGEVNLFRSRDGNTTIEAYFKSLSISGITADLVLTLRADAQKVQKMFDRGLRISQLGSGSKKVNLAAEDLADASSLPIRHITYLPAANLDETLVGKLFGEPDHRVPDPDSPVIHWLYPKKGLDIGLNPDGKEVFQYLPPGDFEQVLDPLLKARANRSGRADHSAD